MTHAASKVPVDVSPLEALLDNTGKILDAARASLPFGHGQQVSSSIMGIVTETLPDENGSEVNDSNLLSGLGNLFDFIECLCANANDDVNEVCPRGISVESSAKKPVKLAHMLLTPHERTTMKNQLLRGDVLSPSTENWQAIFSLLQRSSSPTERTSRMCSRRLEHILTTLWTCTVARHSQLVVESSNTPNTPMSESVLRFVHDYMHTHHNDQLSFMLTRIFEQNLRCLVDEIVVWKEAILSQVHHLKTDGHTLWAEFIAFILLCSQLIVLMIQLSSLTYLPRETLMRTIFLGESESSRLVTQSEVYQHCATKPVTLEAPNCDEDTVNELEEHVSYCIHPLFVSAEYLSKVQPNLPSRYDTVMNTYQQMIVEITQDNVSMLSEWNIDEITAWKSKLERDAQKTPAEVKPKTAKGVKQFKLFEIAKQRAS